MGFGVSLVIFILISIVVLIVLAATKNEPCAPKWRVRGVITITVAFLLLFVTLPQLQEENKAQNEVEELAADAIRTKQWQIEEEEKEAAIASASKGEIRALVIECQDKIREKLTKGRPSFEPYFARYESSALNTLGSMSRATGGALGRLSVALDDYEFDPVDHNVEQIMREKYPSRSIIFVVEHTMDSFSDIKRYVTTYRCYLDGLDSPGSPSRGEVYFMD